MDLLPAIDLRGGAVVRLERGDDERRTTYGTEPLAVLESYAEAGTGWVHVVDLDAAFGQAPQRELIESLASAGGPSVQVGGGLGDETSIAWALDVGCARAVVGSLVARDPDRFAEIAGERPDRLVPALDVADGKVRIAGWTEDASLSLADLCRRLRDLPCPAVLGTDVARDGLMSGPNLDLARRLAGETGIPALVSGGVRSIDDVKAACAEPRVGGIVVGKALYEGALDLEEALAVCAEASGGAS